MDITPFINHNINIITKYNNFGIYINDQFIDYDIILTPYSIEKFNGDYGSILKHIEINFYNNKPVVIVGNNFATENYIIHIEHLFSKVNISPEVMLNVSAYKTYNILASEEREVIMILNITR